VCRVPAGCQAVSLNGARWQWCSWFINRATAVDRSQCECAVVLANKAEQRAILAPDWRHDTGYFAEAPQLGGLDTRCIQVDNEESRRRRGGAQRPEQIEDATSIRRSAWDRPDECQLAGGGSPLVGVQATGAVVGRR
jgi:hypothetical protein